VRVLVTGCAGFIGSHLCEALLADRHEVVGVDALTEYYDPGLKLKNLEQCLDSSSFRFERCLITGLEPRWLEEEAELIFHLAAQPGIGASWGADFENVSQSQRSEHAAFARRRPVFKQSQAPGLRILFVHLW